MLGGAGPRRCASREAGQFPSSHAATWRREALAIREFIETRCWSQRLGSYTRHAGGEELDASLLLGVLLGYERPDPGRLAATVDALRRESRARPAALTATAARTACAARRARSSAARSGSPTRSPGSAAASEAAELMEQLIALANDVGLYAEEVDPDTNELLGNIPQGLVHLALINAAVSIAKASAR